MHRLYEYCEAVEGHKILTCELVKKAVKRFRDDIKKSQSKDYPYTFDETRAQNFIDFTESLKQYKDKWAGQKLHLEPWQVFCLGNVYGWVRKDTHTRRFQKAFIFVARKNGKSMMVSAPLIWDVIFTAGGEAYTAATKKDQAKIVMKNVQEMVRQNVTLSRRLTWYSSTNTFVNLAKASKITALSKEYQAMDGLNPSVVVADEVSAMKNYDIINVLASGQYSRPEPLMFLISSASDNVNSVGAQELEYSKQILYGTIKDDAYFCMCYTLDDGDNWKNPNVWAKANPNLNVSVFEDKLRSALTEALIKPEKEIEFRTKNLNCFVSPVTSWIPASRWIKCIENADSFKLPEDRFLYCMGAVDLSKVVDFTSYTLSFYDPIDNKFYFKRKRYIPEEQVEIKCGTDSPKIWKWIEQGYITATPGPVVDQEVLFRDMEADLEKYSPREILYDPYNASALMARFKDKIDLVECKQNMATLSPMAKDYEAAIYEGAVVDDDPVMAWEISNADVYTDANGNIKPIKHGGKKSNKHIDSVISSMMCVGRTRYLERNGEIDTRTPEQIAADMEEMLKNIDI